MLASEEGNMTETTPSLYRRLGGYDVIAHIRRHNPDLPAVFASGYGFDARDSTPVIQKPYSRVELLRRLRVMLDAATPAVTA